MTMFISGASRGIGLEIAKRIAADGANVALIAKTAEPHPKLPGTIFTAAAEIEAMAKFGMCLCAPGLAEELHGAGSTCGSTPPTRRVTAAPERCGGVSG
jgi:NAD(P)-dependent dehydrogenase (short-subunit alcohol dehydrogenase family)